MRRASKRRIASHRHADTPWSSNLLCTPLRSHFASGLAAAGLIAATTWIWLHPQTLTADRAHRPEEIKDAIQLISNRERLENRHRKAMAEQQRHHERVEAIAEWLPEERTWEDVRVSLQSAAAASDVQIVALDRGNTYAGTRIAVMVATCEVQAPYRNICAYLKQLAEAERPVWCDEIRIVRGHEPDDIQRSQTRSNESVECLATISLRIPLAGKETTAEKLLRRRPRNGS